jgi:hypothetical protein
VLTENGYPWQCALVGGGHYGGGGGAVKARAGVVGEAHGDRVNLAGGVVRPEDGERGWSSSRCPGW